MRLAAKIIGLIAAVYVMLLACVMVYLRTPEGIEKLMANVPRGVVQGFPWRRIYLLAREGSLQVGDPAPDFHLEQRGKSPEVRLSSFENQKPVVLVFGSFT